MNASSRWVLLVTVALSSFSAGLALVAVGCRNADSGASPVASAPATVAAALSSPAERDASTSKAVPEPAQPALPASSTRLEAARLVVTTDVIDREPVASPALVAGRPIVAFVELKNPRTADAVVVTFERGDAAVGHVKLAVPGRTARYRTWARTRLVAEPGTWHAVVRSADGRELARERFEVMAKPVESPVTS